MPTKMPPKKTHSKVFKLETLRLLKSSGKTKADLEREFGLDLGQIHLWGKAFNKEGGNLEQARYMQRAGIEGTLSQGVRAYELPETRYIGLAKTHLQHILMAAGINIVRIMAWLSGIPRAETRVSHFAALALLGPLFAA